MTCPNCGAPTEPHHRFCPDCGRALPERPVDALAPALGDASERVRALAGRTKMLRVALWGAMAISAFNVISFGAQPAAPIDADAAEVGAANAISAFVVLLISIAAPIFWLFWQRHAQANLLALGMRELRFSPGWAVGWWVIPFANLVMPFKTVGELVRRSTGETETPPWLAAWWGCFVGSTVLVAFGSALVGSPDGASVDQGYYAMSVGAAAHVIAGAFALRLVRRVQAGQERLAGIMG